MINAKSLYSEREIRTDEQDLRFDCMRRLKKRRNDLGMFGLWGTLNFEAQLTELSMQGGAYAMMIRVMNVNAVDCRSVELFLPSVFGRVLSRVFDEIKT